MIIRSTQMKALEAALEDSFVGRMVLHLRQDFQEDLRSQRLAGVDLEPTVRAALNRADALGLTREDYLRMFVECIAILGPQFDSDNAVVRDILNAPDLSVDEKMGELNNYLLFGLGQPR